MEYDALLWMSIQRTLQKMSASEEELSLRSDLEDRSMPLDVKQSYPATATARNRLTERAATEIAGEL